MSSVAKTFVVATCIALAGCSTSFEKPRNSRDLDRFSYVAERISMSDRVEDARLERGRALNMGRCADLDLVVALGPLDAATAGYDEAGIPLSPGDVIRIEIANGDGFSGDYIVEADGKLRMPFIDAIPAAGLLVDDVRNLVSMRLLNGRFFQPSFLQVNVELLQHATIRAHVSGAVFQSGVVNLNEKPADAGANPTLDLIGDAAPKRSLSAALFSAGGVRPDADVHNVVLMRAGQRQIFDVSGAFTGDPYPDPVLIAGDQVHVPSKGCFQEALARPSRVTMPGIRIFISNLTQPALNNASSSVGADSTRVPYGTKLLQGLVSGNCVGGIQATNANRYAVLISENPVTGKSEVIARSIEDLVRRSDRDDFNPVLLPGDAIACYDSHVTNLRDVLSTVSSFALPVTNALLISEQLK